MDVGGATRWSPGAVVSRREMLDALARHYGPITPIDEESSAPADRFALPDGTIFGIISSTTEPFCDSCDRSRLTADGVWLMCLYASAGTDLRRPLRAGATADELRHLIATVWSSRADRGAEERLGLDGARDPDPRQRPQEGRASRDAYKGGIGLSTVGSRESGVTVGSLSPQSQSLVQVVGPSRWSQSRARFACLMNSRTED